VPWANEDPATKAAGEGYGTDGLDATRSTVTVTANSEPTYTVITDGSGERILLSSAQVSNTTANRYDPGIGIRLTIEDDVGDPVFQAAGHIGEWPVQLLAEPKVPDGGAAVIRIINPTSNSIDVRIAHTWRL
jgi:hypothetical protein